MSNTIAGFNTAGISQSILKGLKRRFAPIRAYTTDFSGEFMVPGYQSITTSVITNTNGAEYTTSSTGYTSTDFTGTAVVVTPTIMYEQYVMNDLERNRSSRNPSVLVGALTNAVANKCFAVLNAIVLNAAYATNLVSTSANFDADDLADLNVTLTATKQAQAEGRVAILGSAYAGALSKDADVTPAYAYGSPSVIQDGVLPRVRGFEIHELTSIATNSENLVGWVSDKQAIVCVSRMPNILNAGAVVDIQTVVDEDTGMSLALVTEYANGNLTIRAETLFGVAKGTDTLVRILSA